MAQGRLRRLNILTNIPVLGVAGLLIVVFLSDTWWHALIVGLSVVAALVAVWAWASDKLERVAAPCLAVTGAVWVLGALVFDNSTAAFGLMVVGPLWIPRLTRHRGLAAIGLVTFVTGVGAARLLVAPGDDVDATILHYLLIPGGVTAIAVGFMFPNKAYNDLIIELAESREREAALAVDRERIRFASELHDIQGHTLHVVKLKIALAQKLVRSDLDRVEEELREVHALVSETIKQTKELAYAQRRLNLSVELENAKNLFEAAGIRVYVERTEDLDPHTGELLGQVLRETTTNILRHAEAREVWITLTAAGITIVNDGVPEDRVSELRGLSTLRERLAQEGGELTVKQSEGRFLTAASLTAASPTAATMRKDLPLP